MLNIDELRQLHKDINRLAHGVDPLTGTNIFRVDLFDDNIKKILNKSLEVIEAYGMVVNTVSGTIMVPQKEEVVTNVSEDFKDAVKLPEEENLSIRASNNIEENSDFGEAPLSISQICNHIRENLRTDDMPKISAAMLNNWLMEKGYLETDSDGKNKTASVSGISLGIKSEERVKSQGEKYIHNLYNGEAQKFIFDSLVEICEYVKNQKK